MDQKQHEVEQTVNIVPVAHKSCSESFTPTKKLHVKEIPLVDSSLVSPTPVKTEETVNRGRREPAKVSEKQALDQEENEGEQTDNVLLEAHKSCSESFTPTKEPNTNEIPHFDADSVAPTLEKTEETLAKLPEKQRLLSELFDRMTSSLRLLNLHKQLPTFQNIRRIVEVLTEREFSYKNLAQIKFILPEAVQIDKILLHNKKTLCMEPHMRVALLFDVVEGHTEHSDYLALSQLVFSRLLKLVNEHSEDYDVPEAVLPEPFNRKVITVSTKSLPLNSSIQTRPNLDETEPLSASHLPPSFKRHFSPKEFKTKLSQSPVLSSSIKEMDVSTCLDSVKQEKAVDDGNTPTKNLLVVNEINIETPDLSTPRRSMATEDNKSKNTVNKKVLLSGPFTKRVLDFSGFDEENACLDVNSTSDGGSSAKVAQWVGRFGSGCECGVDQWLSDFSFTLPFGGFSNLKELIGSFFGETMELFMDLRYYVCSSSC
ncbi:uncharacterized protein LOC143620047 [Bidens hawaiensis]|uniref:uncharacterized protein LOC143620047 n=1 Tax=Bidens hawaiensis TaxID=980011 RepID=UPI00404A7C93